MTEHDGLTAEQEAKRRWPTATPWAPTPAQGQNAMHFAFVSGAEWATEREKARAEAAEARLSELEGAVWIYIAAHDVLTDTRRIAEWGAWEDHERDSMAVMRALAAPTTEAVTEVEGS